MDFSSNLSICDPLRDERSTISKALSWSDLIDHENLLALTDSILICN